LLMLSMLIAGAALAEEAQPPATSALSKVDTGDTSWILISTALVMLMTPGLALFYGGDGAIKECSRNHHAEFYRARSHHNPVGSLWI